MIGAQAILILFNVLNAFFDASRIKRGKKIQHWINFLLYGISIGLILYFTNPPVLICILFCVSAFFNRQLFFDVVLNVRRGLPWYYVSLDKPPKALMDRIEVRIFGYDGRTPTELYACLWVATMLTINFIKSF
jgi:hypothetical protein